MSGARRVDLPPSASSSAPTTSKSSSTRPSGSTTGTPGSAPTDRVSVFSRLGTKSSGKSTAPPAERSSLTSSSAGSNICRQWFETGHCPFGSKCKKSSSHSLVSPSKRSESVVGPPSDPRKDRPVPNTGGKGKKGENGSPSFDPDWMNWDEKNLDFDDELMLEKKRQLLERELAKQLAEEDSRPPGSAPSASMSALGSMAKKIKLVIPTAIAAKKPLPPQTVATSAPPTSAVNLPHQNSSSTSSSSSSDSDSSSSSDSSSESSSEPTKKKSKTPLKKPLKRSSDDKIKRKDKTSERKPLKSSSSKIGSSGNLSAKKTPTKNQVGGSKLSRHRAENSDKRKVRKVKKARGSSSKRPHSPISNKGGKRSASGSNKDDRSQEPKSSNNPIRKGSERDKFGFYHAVAAPSQSNEGGGSSSKDRTWKGKAGSSSGTKRDQRRSSLSPTRLSSEGGSKRSRKNVKPSLGAKRSLSSDRRGGGATSGSGRPPISPGENRRRSSHSPHGGKKRSSPKSFAGGASRSGSTGRDRDLGRHPVPRDDRDHRDVRRDDGNRGAKYDRDRRAASGGNRNESGGQVRTGRGDNWEQERGGGRDDGRTEKSSLADRRGGDRYQGSPTRDDRHYKDRGGSPAPANRDRGSSPSSRSAPRGQSPGPRLPPRGRSPVGRVVPVRGQSPASRTTTQSGGHRMKEQSNSKIQFSGGNAVRIEPRGDGHTREKYPQHSSSRISRERERSPRERLLPAEALSRDRISRERDRSRERLLPPEVLQRERFSRERSPRDKYQPQSRFSRERERLSGGPAPSRERMLPDYPDRASPFDRLGHHPLSHKRWEGGEASEREYSKFGPTDRDEGSKSRSSKSESSESRTKPEAKHDAKTDESISRPETFSSKDESSSSAASDKGEASNLTKDAASPLAHSLTESTATTQQVCEMTATMDDSKEDKEAFSDLEIGDSDEEILNKINPNENEEEGQLQTSNEAVQDDEDETEEGEVGGLDSRSSSRKSNVIENSELAPTRARPEKSNNDLLEGISDEDLDISDDDEAKSKAKIADALGVDWTQLMTSKTSNDVESAGSQVTDIRKRWSVVSIFNRIGISKKILGNEEFNRIVSDINDKSEDGEKLELLHDVAGFHMRLKAAREKRRSMFANIGPYAGALTARKDISIRRLLCNMIEDDPIEIPQPVHDMDLHRKSIELFRIGNRSNP